MDIAVNAFNGERQVPFDRVLGELGWSREQLIARVNVRRFQRGLHPLNLKSAYPWARGTRPRDDNIDDILAVLSEHTGRTVTGNQMGWDRRRPRTKTRALDSPCNASASELVRETQGDAPMHRRSFLLLSGAAVTAPALDLLISGAPAMASAQDGDRVSLSLLDSVERTVRQTRDLDDTEGSTPALSWAGGIWQNLARILTDSSYPAHIGARLQTAYIEMSETYGWMLFDACHHAQAQRVYQTGLRLAREAEDDLHVHQAAINLLASAAYQATWLDQRNEAATILHVALNRTPQALTPRLRAVIADRQIALAGRTGDTEQLHRLQDQACTDLTNANDDDPWWSLWLTSDRVEGQTGRAWLETGDANAAERYLSGRTQPQDATPSRDRMLYATELALARTKIGDIKGASVAAGEAHHLSAHIGTARVQKQLHDVTRTLAQQHSDHTSVQQLLTRYPDAI